MSPIHSFAAFHETYSGAKGAAAFPKRSRKLAFAKGMEERGVSNEKIREQTGWFRNPFDQKWRFEISDAQIQYKTITYNDTTKYSGGIDVVSVLLPDLIRATTLFREYPRLRETKVVLCPEVRGNTYGEHKAGENRIELNGVKTDTYRDIFFAVMKHKRSPLPEAEWAALQARMNEPLFQLTYGFKQLLFHEIQHAVQYLEGFARGGSPDEFRDIEIDSLTPRLEKLLAKYLKKYPELRRAKAAVDALPKVLQLSSPEFATFYRLGIDLGYDAERAALVTKDRRAKKKKITAHTQYQNLAGEIEARDTAARYHLPGKAVYMVYDVRYSAPQWVGAENVLGKFKTRENAEKALSLVGKKHRLPEKYLDIAEVPVHRQNKAPLGSENIVPGDVTTRFYR